MLYCYIGQLFDAGFAFRERIVSLFRSRPGVRRQKWRGQFDDALTWRSFKGQGALMAPCERSAPQEAGRGGSG